MPTLSRYFSHGKNADFKSEFFSRKNEIQTLTLNFLGKIIKKSDFKSEFSLKK